MTISYEHKSTLWHLRSKTPAHVQTEQFGRSIGNGDEKNQTNGRPYKQKGSHGKSPAPTTVDIDGHNDIDNISNPRRNGEKDRV